MFMAPRSPFSTILAALSLRQVLTRFSMTLGGRAGYGLLISTYSILRVGLLAFGGFFKKNMRITSRGRSMVGRQSCCASKGLPTSTELTVWIRHCLVDSANELQYCWGVVVVLLSPESVWFFAHQFPPLSGYEYLRVLQNNSRGHTRGRVGAGRRKAWSLGQWEANLRGEGWEVREARENCFGGRGLCSELSSRHRRRNDGFLQKKELPIMM